MGIAVPSVETIYVTAITLRHLGDIDQKTLQTLVQRRIASQGWAAGEPGRGPGAATVALRVNPGHGVGDIGVDGSDVGLFIIEIGQEWIEKLRRLVFA